VKGESMQIREWVSDFDPNILLADGFEEAIIGVCERFGMESVAAYNRNKCIQILVDRDGMTYEEAEEFFEYNTLGAWVGDRTPVFITTFEPNN
tara:strand:- start:1006 stop:1284 length:279 start_codon:yes stop_codon:yes gene_type:complete